VRDIPRGDERSGDLEHDPPRSLAVELLGQGDGAVGDVDRPPRDGQLEAVGTELQAEHALGCRGLEDVGRLVAIRHVTTVAEPPHHGYNRRP
jgi:hypothetical protein